MKPLHWMVMATHLPAGGSLGGVVRYTTELLRALADRDDVIVSALTTTRAAPAALELIGSRGRVRTVPGTSVVMLSFVERYLPLPGLRTQPDVVHGMKHLVPTRSNAVRVLTVHDMLLLDRPADFGLAKRKLLPTLYRSSIRDADLLLCVSNATQHRLSTLMRDTQHRSEVVHLATSPALQHAVGQQIGQLAGRRFVLVVGDSSPRKNLRTVLDAWPAIRAVHPDVVLAIAGPPSWGRTESGADFESMARSGEIAALGHVDDSELRWAYEHASVVLCPSLSEGYGLPAVEALDFNAPIVISNDPALVEVAAGRARAVLPALAIDRWSDAIIDILEHPAPSPDGDRRTWAQVADETVAAVRRTMQHRPVRANTS
jgi:glycosyltransferase involved in cell wall biosynthesis